MALTEHDKKTLSKSDQQKIVAATNAWDAANAKGDANGMKAAAAVRNNAGYQTDSSGNYTGSYTPTSSGGSSGGNSQYTGSSTGIATNNSVQQSIKDQMNANSIAWWSADETEKKRLEETNKLLASYLGSGVTYNNATGTWSGSADKVYFTDPSDIAGWNDAYNQDNPKEEYESKYNPQIDAILNEILNRDDFSYDVTNDPLYQQYAKMYQREGDRAMKETMAEAAAGAGGMNTYAITAAQQANSYYNSQLNDKIPQLYQLAYDMYINDKESKVQDLGILQNMDATQYNRYRDTINDYYNDKNFAYGVYQDAVQQGNWETEFDYKSMWDNNYFNNNNYWKNKDLELTNREWDYNTSQAEEEKAYNKVMEQIANGATTIDPELIKQAGITEVAVNQMIAAKQAEKAKKGKSASASIIEPTEYEELKQFEDTVLPGSENYQSVEAACNELFAKSGKDAVLQMLQELRTAGKIDQSSYMTLYNRYRG